MTLLVVFGAGGHAKVVADAVVAAGGDVLAFVDDDAARAGTAVLGVKVRPATWLLEGGAPSGSMVALGVGDNAARQRIATRCRAAGLPIATVLHPTATVAASAVVGEGTYVGARAVINPSAVVGMGAIINTAAIVEHDVIVGDFAHVAPGACLAGGSRLGARSHLGAGAVVLDDVIVEVDTIVGGGSLVNRAIPAAVVAYGVPARVRRERQST